MTRKLTNTILVLATCLATAMFMEIMLRRLQPRLTCVRWGDYLDGIFCSRPNLAGFCALPGSFETRVTINSQRFRGTSHNYALRPAPGTVRIMAMGDSFTWGLGVNDSETYPAQLEAILNNRTVKVHGPTVEAINSGQIGTATGDQALFYDRWSSQFHPQLVILQVFTNDVQEDYVRQLFSIDAEGNAVPQPIVSRQIVGRAFTLFRLADFFPGYSFLSQHSQLLNLFRDVGTRIASARSVRRTGNQEQRSVTGGIPSHHEDGLTLMHAEMKWLNKRIRKDNARLIVVLVPPRECVYLGRFSDEYARSLRSTSAGISDMLNRLSKETQIPVLDLTEPMRTKAKEMQTSLYHFEADIHTTAEGNRCIAELVSDFLIQESVLTIEHIDTAQPSTSAQL